MQVIAAAVQSRAPADFQTSEEHPPGFNDVTEIIAPMQVQARTESKERRGRRAHVMAALTPEAIWIQDTWQLRCVPLLNLVVERQTNGKDLALTLGPETAADKVTLTFPSFEVAERWHKEIQEIQKRLALHGPRGDLYQPEGVSLVRSAGHPAR